MIFRSPRAAWNSPPPGFPGTMAARGTALTVLGWPQSRVGLALTPTSVHGRFTDASCRMD